MTINLIDVWELIKQGLILVGIGILLHYYAYYIAYGVAKGTARVKKNHYFNFPDINVVHKNEIKK